MKRAFFSPSLFVLVTGLFCLACLAGCAKNGHKGGPPDEAGKDVHVHTVEWPGETLPMIAQWYTGNKDNGKILARTNPNLAAERLVVGDRVQIPLGMMKNSKKMPREFLATFSAKPRVEQKKPPSKTKQAPEKQEDFQPYGPK